MKFLAWLRHKLFGTEFAYVSINHEYIFFKKVYRTSTGIPYIVGNGVYITLSEDDYTSNIKRVFWIYKNKVNNEKTR
jgi:hypothetical protein